MPNLLLFLLVVLLCASFAHAFGAGNIPSISKIEGQNFRHGDIEDTLAMIAMSAGGGLLSKIRGGKKFDRMAIKRVYFGNWLRDYSQAIDIATLKQGLTSELLTAIVWILGIMEFGYGTGEFQVTEERLGTYRADEHIDNPKGYGEGEDAPRLDRRLRGPVKPVELEIDPQTGMKNYICNERGDWPTSSVYVRDSIHKCIALGRQGGSENQYEALRLLGQALHTLEDFPAHSNYCELVLMEMGHNVFPHVGRDTQINLNGNKVYPLITGTFGGLDFVHSLIGAANDSLSEVEIEDVNNHVAAAADSKVTDMLKGYLRKLPIKLPNIPDFSGGSREMSGVEIADMIDNYERDMQTDTRDLYGGFEAGPDYASNYTGGSRDFDTRDGELSGDFQKLNIQNKMKISTPDLSSIDVKKIERRILPLLKFRDAIMYGLEKVFDSIPGLSSLTEKISETMSLFVFGLISPIVKPMIAAVTKGLHAGAGKVTSGDDQIEVWKNPRASDPTHSQLSKDHFSLYLNEPAGKVAAVIVLHVVPLVVAAWGDNSIDPNSVTNTMMEVMHHPSMCRTPLQQQMKDTVKEWINGLGSKKQVVLDGLSPDGVLNGANNTGGKKHDQGDHSGCSHASSTANLSAFMAGKFGKQSYTTGQSDSWQSGGGSGMTNQNQNSYQQQQNQNQGMYGGDNSSNNSNKYGSNSNKYGSNSNQGNQYGSNSDNKYGSNNQSDNKYGSNNQSSNQYGSGSSNQYGSNSGSKYDNKSDNKYGSNSGSQSHQSNQYGSGSQSNKYDNDNKYGSNSDNKYGSQSDNKYDSGSSNKYDNDNKYGSGSNNQYGSSSQSSNQYGSSNEYGSSNQGKHHGRKNSNEYGSNSNSGNSGKHHGRKNSNEYGQSNDSYGNSNSNSGKHHGRKNSNEYGSNQGSNYGSNNQSSNQYGSNQGSNYGQDNQSSYGQSNQSHGSSHHGSSQSGYPGSQQQSYGSSNQGNQYGQQSSYGNQGNDYNQGNQGQYGNQNQYGQRDMGQGYDQNQGQGYNQGYDQNQGQGYNQGNQGGYNQGNQGGYDNRY